MLFIMIVKYGEGFMDQVDHAAPSKTVNSADLCVVFLL